MPSRGTARDLRHGTTAAETPTRPIAISWISVAYASALKNDPDPVAHQRTAIEAAPETITENHGAPPRVVLANTFGSMPSNEYANSMRVGWSSDSHVMSGQNTQ